MKNGIIDTKRYHGIKISTLYDLIFDEENAPFVNKQGVTKLTFIPKIEGGTNSV